MAKPPAVRETETRIEIDQKRGEWPYLTVERHEDDSISVMVDVQSGEFTAGQGRADLRIGKKKAHRLLWFLMHTDPYVDITDDLPG